MFDHNPFSVGVAGGFASEVARELFADADLVIAVGASLTYYTVDGGALFPKAFVAQIDERPLGLRDGMQAAELFVKADAKAGVEALTQEFRRRGARNGGYRSPGIAEQIATTPIDSAEFAIAPGTFDPRRVIAELDRAIPKDWDMVSGSGHQSYFQTHMRGRKPENSTCMREFGAIGNSISIAHGRRRRQEERQGRADRGRRQPAHAHPGARDLRRHGMKLLICVLNDGAYGAEIHKLRQDGLDDREAIFGRHRFRRHRERLRAARNERHRSRSVAGLMREYEAQDTAEIWNIPISDQVTSPSMRSGQDQGPRRDLGFARVSDRAPRQGIAGVARHPVPAGVFVRSAGECLAAGRRPARSWSRHRLPAADAARPARFKQRASLEEAARVIAALDGKEVNGKPIHGFRIEQRMDLCMKPM